MKNNRLFSRRLLKRCTGAVLSGLMVFGMFNISGLVKASAATADALYTISNSYFNVGVGKFGQIVNLQLVGDSYGTNYVMNGTNCPKQDTTDHEWMGELMFKTKVGTASSWTSELTSASNTNRAITKVDNNTITVTYQNCGTGGIKDFKLVETYQLVGTKLHWSMAITNTNTSSMTFGDFGVPLAFNEYWSGGDEIYETRTVIHSFVGEDSSYVYATRPSGLGKFLLLTPDSSTDTKFEYQDHWVSSEHSGTTWAQDTGDWANGLNVFYIHSNVIKSTGRGYLPNTSLTLAAGETKTYAFDFSACADQADMSSQLYNGGLVDAVAVPSMVVTTDTNGKLDLHTSAAQSSISMTIAGPDTNGLHTQAGDSNNHTAGSMSGTAITYSGTKTVNGEQHLIYNTKFTYQGQNNVTVNYGNGKKTVLQFYVTAPVADALLSHSNFMVNSTQWNAPGQTYDKVFDDWMMNTQSKRNSFDGAWGWGDDWGLTHGEYIAEQNVLTPVATQVQAVNDYLNTAVWNGLMKNDHSSYLVPDWINTDTTYRGYAYPHIYNTYFAMYKIENQYPDLISYTETKNTCLLRCYNIMNALYNGSGVSYNIDTGLMGEQTTPEIIAALKKEGYTSQANNLISIMATKYNNFSGTTYPYGSEYSYDNTGEEAVYTLAKMNNNTTMMSKINAKTRACRGAQPTWYAYGVPETICGEAWWNFQYTAALAGYCMDDWLRLETNGMTNDQKAIAERQNYAGKLANITCINTGNIDGNSANIGASAWTYQSELGTHYQGSAEGGTLCNGWRQMTGESDLGLYGAIRILSSDVVTDPVFGLIGYGCDVVDNSTSYTITPKDGIFKKLNLINENIYMALERDNYTTATVNKDGSGLSFTLKNLTSTAHNSNVTLTGLGVGNYTVKLGGSSVATFTVANTKTAVTVAIPVTNATTAAISIAPTVAKPVSSIAAVTATTTAGVAPVLPSTVTATFTDGTTGTLSVNWASIPESSYASAGTFTVTGTVSGTTQTATCTVTVGAAVATNIAASGTPSTSFCSSWETLSAINDGNTPANSADHSNGAYGNWDNAGATEWVEYDFAQSYSISQCKVYWFDDNSGLDVPASCNYQYWNGTAWVNFSNQSGLGVADDTFNVTTFTPATTTKIRLNVTAKSTFSTGILEWQVYGMKSTSTATISSLAATTATTTVGTAPTLPSTVTATYSDNTTGSVAVTWAAVAASSYASAGTFTVSGTVSGTTLKATCTVTVNAATATNIASLATTATSYCSSWETLSAINDGYTPSNSADTTHGEYGNWDNPAATEYVEYDFTKSYTLSKCSVYWFDDNQGIDKPASCYFQYWNATTSAWVNCSNQSGLGVADDTFNVTTFTPVSTTKIRLYMIGNTGSSTGVTEWQAYGY